MTNWVDVPEDGDWVDVPEQGNWVDVPDPATPETPGWLESLGTSLEKGIGNIAQGVAGGIDFAETSLGTGTGLGKSLLEMERQYQEPRIRRLAQVEQGSPQFYANSVTEGLTSSLPILLSGGALGAATTGGALGFGQQYDRAQQLGATPEDATSSALLSGTSNALLSVPVFQAAQATGPLLQRMLTSAGVNTAASIPSTLSQAYADSIATQGEVKPYELIEPLKQNAITSALTGTTFPVAVSAARALRGVGKTADPIQVGEELRGRFSNRPLMDGPEGGPAKPSEVSPTQQLLPEMTADNPAPRPQVDPVVSPDAPAPSSLEVLKNQIDQIKASLQRVSPQSLDPEPAKLPEPDPIVSQAEPVKAPSEGESFPVPLDSVESSKALVVQKNRAQENAAEDIGRVVEPDESSWARLAKKAEELNITPLDPTQAWFEGQVFGRDVPVVSKMLAGLRRTSMPRTISDKFPEAQDLYYKGGRAEVENEAMVASEMTELLRPYFKSDNPQLVDTIIGQTREITKQFQRERTQAIGELKTILKRADDIMSGRVKLSGDVEGVKQYAMDLAAEANKQLDTIKQRQIPRLMEDDMKALGATDADVNAVLAHKDAMNYGLERVRETLKLQGRKIKNEKDKINYNTDVDEYINGLLDTNYFPARRYEDAWAVELKDKDGNVLFRKHADSQSEAKKIARDASKQYKMATEKNVFALPKIDMDAFPDLPANLSEQLKQFDPGKYSEIADGRPVQGWTRHLINAEVIPGYDPDIKKSTIDYALGLSRYYGRQQARAVLDDLITNLPEGSALRGYATRYANEQLKKPEGPVTKGVLKFNNFMKLAGVPTSALINTTQTLTTTVPKLEGELIKIYGAPRALAQTPIVMSKIMTQAFGYLADRAGGKAVKGVLRNRNPELFKFLDDAAKTGVLDSEGMRELYNHRQKIQSNITAADSLMFMFSTAEQANRVIALLAGREVGIKKGLSGQALFDYAKNQFVIPTQFDQTVANRPPAISSGVPRMLTQYRPFQLNYFRFIRDNFNKQDWPVVGLSVAAMAGLGGALALPFARDTERIAESMGLSPIKAFRKFVQDEKWADRLLYGLPMDAGVSISGAVSPGEFTAQDVSGQGLAKLFGPTADYVVNQLPKAYDALVKNDNPVTAFEVAGPRFARGPLKAIRGADQSRGAQGGLKNYQGRVILPDVQGPESLALAIGATPARLQKENEIISEEFRVLNAAKSKPKNYNSLIAEAIMNKDQARIRSLMTEIRDYNESLSKLDKTEKEARTIVPDTEEIISQIKSKLNPQVGVILNAPKKARPSLVEMYQRYGKIKKRTSTGIEE